MYNKTNRFLEIRRLAMEEFKKLPPHIQDNVLAWTYWKRAFHTAFDVIEKKLNEENKKTSQS